MNDNIIPAEKVVAMLCSWLDFIFQRGGTETLVEKKQARRLAQKNRTADLRLYETDLHQPVYASSAVIFKILLFQPRCFLVILWNVDAFDLEDDRPGAVVAAGDHHAVVIRPALHDGAALQSRVHIPADGVPGFAAELAVHQVVEIILLRRPFEQKGVTHVEKRAGTGLGIGQVLLLEIRKAFLINDCNFYIRAAFFLLLYPFSAMRTIVVMD